MADHQRSAPGFLCGMGPHGHGAADGLLDGTALDTELLLDCLRLHNIYHQRSAPGVGKIALGGRGILPAHKKCPNHH